MKTSRNKAIIISVLLIFTVMLISALLIQIVKQTDEISGLNKLVGKERLAGEEARSEIEALKAENEANRAEIEALKAEGEADQAETEALQAELEAARAEIGILFPYEYVLVDQRLDPELVGLIKTHFDAIAAGDEELYRSTLKIADNEYLLSFFERQKNTDIELVSVYSYDTEAEAFSDTFVEGPAFLLAAVRRQGTVEPYGIAFFTQKIGGKWVIFDID